MDKFQVMVYSYKDKPNYYKINKIPSDEPNRPSQPNRIDTNDETMDESAFTQTQSLIEEVPDRNRRPNTNLRSENNIIQNQYPNYDMSPHFQPNMYSNGDRPEVAPRSQTHRRMGPGSNMRISNRKSMRDNESDLHESRTDLQSLADQDFQVSQPGEVFEEPMVNAGFNFQKKRQAPEPNQNINNPEDYEDEPYFSNEEPEEMAVNSSPLPPSQQNGLTPLEAYENFPQDRYRPGRKRLNEKTTEILKMRAEDSENVLLLFLWRIEMDRLHKEAEKLKEKNNNLEGRVKRMEEKFREMRLDYDEKCDEVIQLQELLDNMDQGGSGGFEEIRILQEKIEIMEKQKIEYVRMTEAKENELDEMDEELKDKEDLINDMKDEIDDLKRKNKELAKSPVDEDELYDRIDDLEKNLKKLKNKNNNLEEENETLFDENEKLKKKNKISESQAELEKDLEEENNNLKDQIKQLKRDKRNLNHDIEDLQDQMMRLKKKAKESQDNEDDELKLRNKELENQIRILKEGNGKLGDEKNLIQKANNRIIDLVEQNNQLQNQLIVLEEELEEEREKENEIEGAKQMLNFYKKRAENLEVKSSIPGGSMHPAQSETNQDVELENQDLKDNLDKAEQDIKDLTQQVFDKDKELKKLQGKVEKEEFSNQKLRDAKRKLEKEVRDLSKNPNDREALIKKNERLMDQMKTIEERLENKEKERDMLESSIIKTNEEVLRLKRLLAQKENYIEDMGKSSTVINVQEQPQNENMVNASMLEELEKKTEELTLDNQQMGEKIEELFKELEMEAAKGDQLRIQVMLLATELERKEEEVVTMTETIEIKEEEITTITEKIEMKEAEMIEVMKERNSAKHNVNRQMEKLLQQNKQFGLEKEMEINKLKMEKNKLLNYVDIYKKNTEEMERKIAKLIQKHETLKEKYTAQQNLISSLQASDIGRLDNRGENKVLLGKIKELEMKNRVLEIENQKLDELLYEKMKEIELKPED